MRWSQFETTPDGVPEIPGPKVVDHRLLSQLRIYVSTLVGDHRAYSNGRLKGNFPGAQPVSFTRSHLETITQQEYFVCEKSDGLRLLVLILSANQTEIDLNSLPEHGRAQSAMMMMNQQHHHQQQPPPLRNGHSDRQLVYLIDRKNDFYLVDGLVFPASVAPGGPLQYQHGTLLDAELVCDRVGNGENGRNERILKLYCFDLLVCEKKNLVSRELTTRLGYLSQRVIQPHIKFFEKHPQIHQQCPFQLVFKQMENAYKAERILREDIPNLPHGNDGLIFTAVKAKYEFGTTQTIIKWKPPSENSIDFRVRLDPPPKSIVDYGKKLSELYPSSSDRPNLQLGVLRDKREGYENDHKDFAILGVTEDDWNTHFADMKVGELEGKIAEAAYDEEHCPPHKWRFMRFRNDKSTGNFHKVAESILETIENPTTEDHIIEQCKIIKAEYESKRR